MIQEKKVILHVDDDARVAAAVAEVLRSEGYHVVSAHSAEEGLRKLRHEKPDLLILDVAMPGMSGLTLLRQIAAPGEKAKIPVFIFTAFAARVDDAARSQIDGFFLKPADLNKMRREIARILSAPAPSPQEQGNVSTE